MILFQNQFLPSNEVDISYNDRGYYFGDGVYEVFRVYDGVIFEMGAHMHRLQRSATAIRLQLPNTLEHLEDQLKHLVQLNELGTGIIYLQITRGEAPRTHKIPSDIQPILLAYCEAYPRPVDGMNEGIRAVTVPDIRWHRCDIKSLNLLPNTLAKTEALDQGADEAILHRDGRVTECSASNLMAVKNGQIYTHPANNWILHGVTRQFVIQLANELGITVIEEALHIDDLKHVDELFVTGTTVEVTPVISVDGNPINNGIIGSVTRKLQDAFKHYIG